MKYDINQLVDKVNEIINKNQVNSIDDGRMKALSVRRVRDYQSKNLLPEPLREGKNAFYTDEHVEKLIQLRSLQFQGVSDTVLKKYEDDTSYMQSLSSSLSAYSLNSKMIKDADKDFSLNLRDTLNSLNDPLEEKNRSLLTSKAFAQSANSLGIQGAKGIQDTLVVHKLNVEAQPICPINCSVTLNYQLHNNITLQVTSTGNFLTNDEKLSIQEKLKEVLKNL